MSVTATSNIDLCVTVQQELFGAGRLELADQLITPDCVDHGSESRPDARAGEAAAPRGPEGIKGIGRWLRAAFPDLSYQIDDALGDHDRVALRCTARGTHRGPFLGRPGTQRRFEVQQIHIFRIQDGKIAEHWACRDDVAMLKQLGLAG